MGEEKNMMGFKTRRHLEYGQDWLEWYVSDVKSKHPEYCSMKKVVVADCDGILTDGRSAYGPSGKTFKTYGAYDKEAIGLLSELGWEFMFVTADNAGASITDSRLLHLESSNRHIKHTNANADERFIIVENLINIGNKVLFVGDSLSDIKTLNISTWAATTANAPEIVKSFCEYVSPLCGGYGGFADILLAFDRKLKSE